MMKSSQLEEGWESFWTLSGSLINWFKISAKFPQNVRKISAKFPQNFRKISKGVYLFTHCSHYYWLYAQPTLGLSVSHNLNLMSSR